LAEVHLADGAADARFHVAREDGHGHVRGLGRQELGLQDLFVEFPGAREVGGVEFEPVDSVFLHRVSGFGLALARVGRAAIAPRRPDELLPLKRKVLTTVCQQARIRQNFPRRTKGKPRRAASPKSGYERLSKLGARLPATS